MLPYRSLGQPSLSPPRRGRFHIDPARRTRIVYGCGPCVRPVPQGHRCRRSMAPHFLRADSTTTMSQEPYRRRPHTGSGQPESGRWCVGPVPPGHRHRRSVHPMPPIWRIFGRSMRSLSKTPSPASSTPRARSHLPCRLTPKGPTHASPAPPLNDTTPSSRRCPDAGTHHINPVRTPPCTDWSYRDRNPRNHAEIADKTIKPKPGFALLRPVTSHPNPIPLQRCRITAINAHRKGLR
jgi:hypothetical protein